MKLNLVNRFEADVQQGGEDGALADFLLELRQKDRRHQQNGVRKVINSLEVVLFNIDGVDRACDIAATAINAAVRIQNRMPVLHVDGTGRTNAGAMRAPDAKVVFEF